MKKLWSILLRVFPITVGGKMLPAAIAVLLGCFSVLATADTPVRIMPLGDSITEGIGSTSYNGYRKPLYLNLTGGSYSTDFVGSQTDGDFADPNHEGYGGWRADQIRDNVYNWLVNNPADVVLLHIGTNDITGGDQDVNEVNDILINIDLYEFDYSEQITVILALIIDRQTHSPATTQFNDDVNDMALNRIANGDDIIIVDMEIALNYLNDMADNLHPNDVGYAKMANVWYAALDNLLEAPTIISAPMIDGAVGQLYTYDVNATGYPAPTYALIESPNDMTIDANTGLIEWTPISVGDFNVTVEADNGHLPDANQSFTITVTPIIEFDAVSSNSSGPSGNTLSWSHTIGGDSNRILVVGIAGEDNNAADMVISSVTYNGVGMNIVEQSSAITGTGPVIKTELYYLLDSNLPSSGSYLVEVTYSGNVNKRCAGGISLANVEQQAQEAVATSSNTGPNSISTNITTLTDGSWVVDIVGSDNSGAFSSTSGGMVDRFDVNTNGSTAAGSTKPVTSAGPTTMNWSYSSGANLLAHSAAVFAPAARIISGYVWEPNYTPIEDVSISADSNGGSDMTDPNGYYRVLVPYNWSGTVTPIKAGYLFGPNERTYSNVITDQSEQDYEDITIYDLDDDGFIGWGDVAVINENWLDTGPAIEGDINNDEIVDLLDFAEFALAW